MSSRNKPKPNLMDPDWEPTEEVPDVAQQQAYAQLDGLRERHLAAEAQESGRKPITLRMRLRDVARAQSLARHLGVKYQSLLQELMAEGLARKEEELGLVVGTKAAKHAPSDVATLREMHEEVMAKLGELDQKMGAAVVAKQGGKPKPRRQAAAS